MDIWYTDPIKILCDQRTALDFIPLKTMPLVEQLNASMRFVIYFSILVFIAKRDVSVIFLIALVGILTMIIHQNETQDQSIKKTIMEHLDLKCDSNDVVQPKPTKDNPFMNFTFDDHINFPSKAAADPLNVNVQAEIQKEFNDNQFHDVEDIFNRQNSSRQFYTMPCTTIVNDRESFMKACYNLPKTRKEDSIQTWANLKDKYVA